MAIHVPGPRLDILLTLTFAALAAGCSEPQRATSPSQDSSPDFTPRFTMGSGFGGSQAGRSTISAAFKAKRKTAGLEIDIHAKDPTDIAVQNLSIQPGGHSGWHTHPGPGFVQVLTGTVTFYEDDDACTPIVLTAGQVYVDHGDRPHIARNETSGTVTMLATVFAPVGAALRIDEPARGNCTF